MKKRVICILLALSLLVGLCGTLAVGASAASSLTASDACISLLKQMEGFSKYPYWDYSQWTVGYGTKCPDEDYERYKEEGIPEEEAEALLRQYIQTSENWINSFADKYRLSLSQQQFDALILFTYNCGTGWTSKSGTFRTAVINGMTGNDFIYAICLWSNAGGELLTALVERRLKEANIYLNGVYSATVPDHYGYVRFDGGEGSVSVRVQGYDSNDPVAPFADAERDGFHFAGWFTEGGQEVKLLDASVKGQTLYAHWSESEVPEKPQPETKPEEEETEPTEAETQPETEPEETEPEVTEPEKPSEVKVTVTGDYVNVRKGPGTGYDVVASVKAGQKLTITDTQEGSGYLWGKFESGWIALRYTNYDEVTKLQPEQKPEEKPVEPEQPAEPEKPKSQFGKVTASSLRIRSGAGTSYSITGYLSNGARVEILEQKDVNGTKWGRIDRGWVSMDYIQLEGGSSDNSGNENNSGGTDVIATGHVINTDKLRVRSGAGLDHSVVGYLKMNTKVEIYEKASANGMIWGRINEGWISLDYIQLDSGDAGSSDKVIDSGHVVNTDKLRVRTAPGTWNDIVGYLRMNTRVEIYEKMTVNNMVWGRINEGWISLDYVQLDSQKPDQSNEKTVVASSLRIRSGAGTNHEIVGFLSNGTKVTILETKTVDGTQWGRINEGWISMDYVR